MLVLEMDFWKMPVYQSKSPNMIYYKDQLQLYRRNRFGMASTANVESGNWKAGADWKYFYNLNN